MRGVGIVAAIDLPGNDDAHGRLLLFHGSNLHRRGVRAQQQRSRRALGQVNVERVHVVAHRMEFGNVQRLEVVIRRFDFGAFNNREANRKKDVLGFLEDLANEMARANRMDDAGEREVHALARERGLFRAGFDGSATGFNVQFNVSPQLIEFLANHALQFWSSRLEPVVSDLCKHTGLTAKPCVAKLLPCGFFVNGFELGVEMRKHLLKARSHLRRLNHAESGERFVET